MKKRPDWCSQEQQEGDSRSTKPSPVSGPLSTPQASLSLPSVPKASALLAAPN